MDTYWYKAEVLNVVDGDTVDLRIDLGLNIFAKERVRLAGIDTPEIFGVAKNSEEYLKGMESKAALYNLLKDHATVYVNTVKDKTEKYGRYLAYIYLTEDRASLVNTMLINMGYAKPY